MAKSCDFSVSAIGTIKQLNRSLIFVTKLLTNITTACSIFCQFEIRLLLKHFKIWKGINRKQSTRWQHLFRLKASAFFSLQKNFSCYKTQQLILETGIAIWWLTEPHSMICKHLRVYKKSFNNLNFKVKKLSLKLVTVEV
jgi:hypothetical protein